MSVILPSTGTYYVGVSAFGNSRYSAASAGSGRAARSTGDYLLTVSLDATPPSPPPPPPGPPRPPSDSSEPNDSRELAAALTFSNDEATATGFIGNGTYTSADIDVFAIQLIAGMEITVDIDARTLSTPSDLDSYLQLFDSSGRRVAANDDDGVTLDSFLRYTARTDGV